VRPCSAQKSIRFAVAQQRPNNGHSSGMLVFHSVTDAAMHETQKSDYGPRYLGRTSANGRYRNSPRTSRKADCCHNRGLATPPLGFGGCARSASWSRLYLSGHEVERRWNPRPVTLAAGVARGKVGAVCHFEFGGRAAGVPNGFGEALGLRDEVRKVLAAEGKQERRQWRLKLKTRACAPIR
jgi:hypothetical protein